MVTEEIMKITRLEFHNLTTRFKIRKFSVLPFIGYSLNGHYGWYVRRAFFPFVGMKVQRLAILEATGINEEIIVSLFHFLSISNSHLTSSFSYHQIVYFSLLTLPLIWTLYTLSESIFFDFFQPSSLLDADCSQLNFFPDKVVLASKSSLLNFLSDKVSLSWINFFFDVIARQLPSKPQNLSRFSITAYLHCFILSDWSQ